MVNLTIRLGKAAGVSGKQQQQEQQAAISVSTTTTASAKGPSICPHLAGTDLPLLKGVGTVFSEPCALNFVGVKARRRLGDKVHICVRCDFPIAVYGRLIPCEHVFCLTCAKLDPACFLCEERVTRIQKMDVLEGIFICGAPGCLRSFLVRSDFDLHITEAHPQLLQVEHGRLLSPERNVSGAGHSVPEPQAQSHQSGQQQQHADFAAPATRQSSGTLQVILPKKEEPQRRPPLKGVRQGVDPQALLARPVPELRLPDQFPHHRGGEQHLNREREADVGPQGRDQQKPRRRTEWDKGPQGDNEGEPPRERRWEDGSSSKESSKGIQPPSYGTPKEQQQQQQQRQAMIASLPPPPPPPPPYPPPNIPTAYNQDGNNAFRFGAFHPPPGGGFNYNSRPPPPMTSGSPRPFFYPPEYGIMPPHSHLPPPPPPPPSKRTKFSGEPEYNNSTNNWGNPGNFGGYPNWMPPTN